VVIERFTIFPSMGFSVRVGRPRPPLYISFFGLCFWRFLPAAFNFFSFMGFVVLIFVCVVEKVYLRLYAIRCGYEG